MTQLQNNDPLNHSTRSTDQGPPAVPLTWREWFGEIISGGAISEARAHRDAWETFGDQEANANASAQSALADIISMETPSCAHIGKRMAARAREAIKP